MTRAATPPLPQNHRMLNALKTRPASGEAAAAGRPARRWGGTRWLLGLLLLTAALRGACWSAVVPPFQPNDEPQHFLRVRSVAGDLPVNPPTATVPPTVPLDIVRLGDLAKFGSLERDRAARIDPDPARAAALRAAMADPASRRAGVPDRHGGLVRHVVFDTQHPPLFYWLLALPYRAMAGLTAGGQLLGLRLIVGLCGLAVAAAAWRIGRVLWPREVGPAAALAGVVAFFPTSGFHLSVVNNEALVIALFSVALAVLVGAASGPMTWGRAAALAVLAAAGLLTKASFLAIVPLLACVAAWQLARHGRRRRTLAAWAALAAVAIAASAWWYVPLLRGGVTTPFAETPNRPTSRSTVEPAEALAAHRAARRGMSVWQFARSGLWDLRYRRVLKDEYWGLSLGNAYLDNDPRVPRGARRAMLLVTGLGWAGAAGWLGWRAWRSRRAFRRFGDPPTGALLVLAGSNFFLLGFYLLLDYRFTETLGTGFVVRGQYLMPAVLGALAVAAFGVSLVRPRPLRAAALWAAAAGVAGVNVYTLVYRIGPRYYGHLDLWELCRAVARVQPVPAGLVLATLIALCVAAVGFLALLAATLRAEAKAGPAAEAE